tara:strand:+ start:2464 stop:2856 length:393 start_codon:yes stop_codon:yes gene_type:complete
MFLPLPTKAGERGTGVNISELPNRRKINIVSTARCEDFVFGLGVRGAVYVLQGRMHQHSLENNPRIIRRCTIALVLLGAISEKHGEAAITFAQQRYDKRMHNQRAYGFISDAEDFGILLNARQLKKVAFR